MRKYVGPQRHLELYSWRTVESFLWLPTILPVGHASGPLEWRWLERARISQQVGHNIFGELLWFNRCWTDGELSSREIEGGIDS